MAIFAKIENDVVNNIIIVDNKDCKNLSFPESEVVGQNYIKSLNLDGEWLQTSENGEFREVSVGVGYTYDREKDIFVSPYTFSDEIIALMNKQLSE
jgi:hypothetical protein